MAHQFLTDACSVQEKGDTVLNLEVGTGLRQKDIKELALLSLFYLTWKEFPKEFKHL